VAQPGGAEEWRAALLGQTRVGVGAVAQQRRDGWFVPALCEGGEIVRVNPGGLNTLFTTPRVNPVCAGGELVRVNPGGLNTLFTTRDNNVFRPVPTRNTSL